MGGNQVAINAPHGDVVQNQGAVIASPGTIRISAFGTISLGSLLNIPHGGVILASATGSIGEIGAGSLFAQSLAASAPGSIILEAGTNRITTLSDISAGGRFALISAGSLAIAGTQVAGLDIAITGSLAVSQNSGRIAAGGSGVRIAAPGRGGLLTQDHGATIVATGNDGTIALSGANGLALGGTLSASGTAALVALVTPLGSLTQSTGAITATRLSATAALGIALDAAAAQNRVAAAETLSTTSGALSFTSLSSFALTGVAQAKTAVGLRSAGNLVLTPTARVSASDGPVGLQAGGNLSIQSGAEISGASVSASAPLNLTLGGRIAGDKIFLGAPGGGGAALVAFSDGAILQTAAAGTYGATVPIAAWPNIATAPAGAFIAAKGLSIAGTLTVVGQPGAASQTLRIDLSGQGDVDRAGGLLATTTTVFLNLGSRANLAGQFQVAGLHIAYPRSSAGSADLSGTVRGVGGQAAAQISTVTPTPNALYRINACPIASVSCFVVSTERLPQSIPVRDLEIRPARDTIDETEVLLPNVSRRDF